MRTSTIRRQTEETEIQITLALEFLRLDFLSLNCTFNILNLFNMLLLDQPILFQRLKFSLLFIKICLYFYTPRP